MGDNRMIDFHSKLAYAPTRWEVVLDDENVWSCDGVPETFASEEEAYAALSEFFADCDDAVKLGYMTDGHYDAPYYVREVTK
jgi:hypothetical protein